MSVHGWLCAFGTWLDASVALLVGVLIQPVEIDLCGELVDEDQRHLFAGAAGSPERKGCRGSLQVASGQQSRSTKINAEVNLTQHVQRRLDGLAEQVGLPGKPVRRGPDEISRNHFAVLPCQRRDEFWGGLLEGGGRSGLPCDFQSSDRHLPVCNAHNDQQVDEGRFAKQRVARWHRHRS